MVCCVLRIRPSSTSQVPNGKVCNIIFISRKHLLRPVSSVSMRLVRWHASSASSPHKVLAFPKDEGKLQQINYNWDSAVWPYLSKSFGPAVLLMCVISNENHTNMSSTISTQIFRFNCFFVLLAFPTSPQVNSDTKKTENSCSPVR